MKLNKNVYRDFDELEISQDNRVQFKKQGSNYLVRYVSSNSYMNDDIMKILPRTGETRFAGRYYYSYDDNLNPTKLNKMQFEKLLSAVDKGFKKHAKTFADFYANRQVADSVIYRNEALGLEIVEHTKPMIFQEAEYQGRKVKLGKVQRGGKKKFQVYVRDPKTKNIKKVSFGDTTGLSIKTKDPARRKSFKARHNCDTKKDRTKAGYWSCRMWSGPDAVKNMLKK